MTFSSASRNGLLAAVVVIAVGVFALFLKKGGESGDESVEKKPVGMVPSREWAGSSGGANDAVYPGSVRVEAVLADESISDREVRDALLVIAKDGAAPVEERAEALSHGLILSSDEDVAILEELVSETAWPNELLEGFLDDAMIRPDPERLGLLVEIMVRAKPPLRSEVKDTLEFLLDQDLGEDFEAWRNAADSWSEETAE